MKNYAELEDIIVFGSAVRGKKNPGDIDIALLMKRAEFVKSKAVNTLGKNYDVEVVDPAEMYKYRLFLDVVAEGFSIKENRFLNHIKRNFLIKYALRRLTPSQKVYFNRAVHSMKLKQYAPGLIMVPSSRIHEVDSFFDQWKIKTEKKEVFT